MCKNNITNPCCEVVQLRAELERARRQVSVLKATKLKLMADRTYYRERAEKAVAALESLFESRGD